MERKYELLAPVGDFPMLVTAVNAGANAIYFGLKKFGMRDSSKNFEIKDLSKMREICKKNKVRMYVTLNSIIFEEEIENIEEVIKEIKGKVDAIICWDLSVIQLCKKYKIPFFISTQASVSNSSAAKFYKKLGAKRIICARELSLEQIKEISKVIEVECFVHGAMCVAISGRCFTSQFLFDKSANCGKCMQPCRRSYTIIDDQGNELKVENNKVLSAKDLCTLSFIEDMKSAGVTGFKIEGRTRDSRYVDTTVKVYRKALDKKLSLAEIKEGMQELKKVYNRGFSSGFYLGKTTPKDFAMVENSAATEKKHFIGKVTKYFPKVEVVAVKLVSELKLGDKVVIIGEETGILSLDINRIEINNKCVNKALKGQEVAFKSSLARKNDEVYVIKKIH